MMNRVGNLFQRVRDDIERAFGRWGRIVYHRAWLIILLCAVVLCALFSQLPHLRIVASTEDYLHENDPIRIQYDEYRQQFGRDERIVLVIETDDVFRLDFLNKLRDLHQALEKEVPKLEEVTSLVNARNTRGEGDQLIVKDLFEDFPDNEQELEVIKKIAYANPLYKNNLFTHDGKYTAIVMETDVYSSLAHRMELTDAITGFDDTQETTAVPVEKRFITAEENTAIVHAVDEVVKRFDSQGFKIHVGGSPPMIVRTMAILGKDMYRFTGLSMLVIGILLLLVFRRGVMIILPLLIATLSSFATLSLMAIYQLPMTIAGQIIPSFLIAIGVGNAVHLFSAFFRSFNRGESKEKSLAHALEHTGLAIVMTGLTTAGGLMSFMGSGLKPISDFGIITPIGVICALVLSLVLLPALIAVFPMKSGAMAHRNQGLSYRLLAFCANLACTHPRKVIGVWSVLLLTGLGVTISSLRFSHQPLDWFPKQEPARVAIELLNDHFDGGMAMEMIVDTHQPDGIKNPEVLRRIDRITAHARSIEVGEMYARQSTSVSDITKEIHQALNENRPEFYAIPDDPQLLAQELLLFENSGSDDLEKLVDSQFSKALVKIKVPFTDALAFVPFNAQFEPEAHRIMGDMAEIHFTGIKHVMGTIFYELIHSMATSYMWAILIITPMMIFIIGSLRLGLFSMIVNITPISITLGVMAYMNWPLDAFSLLIGSIALGLVVDDTIHFLHNFQRYHSRTDNAQEAVMQTLLTAGPAMFFTSIVLTAGFCVFAFSIMANVRHFGLLTGLCITLAFLADVLFTPAVAVVLNQKKL